MFSKNKISDSEASGSTRPSDAPKPQGNASSAKPPAAPLMSSAPVPTPPPGQPLTPKPKPSPSLLSSDLTIKGNVSTSGDIQIEGTIEGDVRAHLLTVGETATIRGEVVADDVVVNGRVIGRLRGLKVRLTSTSQVEGDIVHKSIAIESGAHFEGSVQRAEDPLGDTAAGSRPVPKSASDSISAAPPNPLDMDTETA
ncbi:MAG: polymer-forming cytoskeletal protein [Paracoccaceae bacterium]